jgi:malate dehydrogenase (oxaloacetate-decarboxylating)(NADP+)
MVISLGVHRSFKKITNSQTKIMPTSNNPVRSEILRDPRYNRGTAFTLEERDALGITSLLPEAVDTLDIQVARAQTQLAALSEDLQKYLFLSDLQNRNLTLFYALLMSDPATFMPLVYTPTVGKLAKSSIISSADPRAFICPSRPKGTSRSVCSFGRKRTSDSLW